MKVTTTAHCRSVRVSTCDLNEWLNENSLDAPAVDKQRLPAIMPHGLFHGRRAADLVAFTGLVQVDVDARHNEHVPRDLWPTICRTFAEQVAAVEVAQVSASGAGFYALVHAPACSSFPAMAAHVLTIARDELGRIARSHDVGPVAIDEKCAYNLAALRFPGVGPVVHGRAAQLHGG